MEQQNLKIKAIVYAIFLQLIIMILVFFGGLLDPLLGIIVVGVNFFVLGLRIRNLRCDAKIMSRT